ncbi:MAG: GIY-YIG nuclease family protein [Patescibacteria group bacterium]
MPYVYILKSLRDGRYYIGSTIDLDLRLQHHFGATLRLLKDLARWYWFLGKNTRI